MVRTALNLLLVATALSPTAGCMGEGCTDAGCDDAAIFFFPDVSLDESRRVNVVDADGCLGDICHSVRWRFRRGGPDMANRAGIDVDLGQDGAHAYLYLPADNDLTTEELYRAWMEVSINGEPPVRAEDQVRLSRFQPNGPGCDPICLQADVEAAPEG